MLNGLVNSFQVDSPALAFRIALYETQKRLQLAEQFVGMADPQTTDKTHCGRTQKLSLRINADDLKVITKIAKKFVKAYQQAQKNAIADPAAAAAALKKMVAEVDQQQAEEQFAASVPLMQNEISDAEGRGFDAKRLATTWEWVAKAQGMQIDALDPASAIDTSLSE